MRALLTVIFLLGCPAAQKGLVDEAETDFVGFHRTGTTLECWPMLTRMPTRMPTPTPMRITWMPIPTLMPMPTPTPTRTPTRTPMPTM